MSRLTSLPSFPWVVVDDSLEQTGTCDYDLVSLPWLPTQVPASEHSKAFEGKYQKSLSFIEHLSKDLTFSTHGGPDLPKYRMPQSSGSAKYAAMRMFSQP